MFLTYILPFLASFILSLILTWSIKKIALYFKIVDQPGERKIHKSATPLLGGAAIFVTFFGVLFFYSDRFLAGNLDWRHLLGFFSGALLIIIGGILDDKYNLPAKWQIIFPLLAILAVVVGGVEIEKITNPFGGFIYLKDLVIVGPALIALWLLGMMYTTKLLDGVDGLVSGVGAIGALVIFLFTLTTKYFQPDIALAAVILFGSALGFLIFNFYPAKIFLGEGGSLFFGYVLGVLAIISGGKIAIALLIMGIPILDVAWTIMRRLFQGKNPFRFADNKHLHHRLLNLGLNQRQTVLVFYFFSLVFGLSSLFLQSRGKLLVLLLLLIIMLAIVIVFQFLDKRRENAKPSLLLHICCAPCATYISSVRLQPSYNLTWFFYNPNLVSQEEYDKRLQYVKLMAAKFFIPLIIVPYEHGTWCKLVKGREGDAERGARCQLCYLDRLRATVNLAAAKKFDFFATSLTVSPYKDKEAIEKMSRKLAAKKGIKFLEEDFQAADAYRRSQELAKELGIYRQKFCGCEYSIIKKQK
ncbi:MAG: epoxyqueuosine reductase QueH [Candidatus Falkowbacteria bacterium]|nr:MAG: epoxyqueuosine reductase QueH [Candidatus Falkowbacteria bacterium]